ncbi:MAG: response regulator [Candidatus Zixiibacteriota bacterium]|nr:MAG: response regulator [candidate division Zixibacteria bacterium]
MRTRTLQVMLIEDNDDHAELVAAALEVNNLVGNVIRFADAESGLDYLIGETRAKRKTENPLPDLILLDLMLPGMSGMEMLKILKQQPRTKSIPVIVLTTSSLDSKIDKAYELGANSYIAKPIGHQDFVIKLAELNMFWSVTAELPRPVDEESNTSKESLF